MLVAAVLAAGRSTRMGADKLLLPLGDRPILRHVVDAVAGVQPAEILVITSPTGAPSLATAIDGSAARAVVNARAAEGMGTSIACAARSLPEGTDALLLAQGDQPLVSTAALARLIECFVAGCKSYVAARYGDLVTTPVVFDRSLFGELRALGGDRGARRVLEQHRDDGDVVDLPLWMSLDVDDQEGYRRVRELWPPADA
jgi:molybdenum cofactor cytidylyltransferase